MFKRTRLDDQANYLELIFSIGDNNRLYTNMMIPTFTLSTFHSCQETYHHLALQMVFTFCSISDMQDAARGQHYFAKSTISRRKLLICEEKVGQSPKSGVKVKKVGSKSTLLICEENYYSGKKITILRKKLLICEENYQFAEKITILRRKLLFCEENYYSAKKNSHY